LNISVRSYLTAGVAAVGASAIALSPVMVTPTLPEIQIPAVHAVTSDVALAAQAVPNPIERWGEVLQATALNIEDLIGLVVANPAPALAQVVRNAGGYAQQILEGWGMAAEYAIDGITSIPAALQATVASLASGQIEDALTEFLNPILSVGLSALLVLNPLLTVSQQVVNHAAAVINTFVNSDMLISVALVAGGLLLSPINALAHTAQQVVDGFRAGEFGDVVNAVLNIPADLVNSVLNGYGSINFMGIPIPAPGLLSVHEGLSGGLFATLQKVREDVAVALGWDWEAAEKQSSVEVAGIAPVDEVSSVPTLETSAPTVAVDVSDLKVGADTVTVADTVTAGAISEGESTSNTSAPASVLDDSSADEGAAPAKDLKAERKAKREAAKADRDTVKAERKADRNAAKAERASKRDAAKSERASKRSSAGGSADSGADAA
jgi:hypothetical protein